MSISGIAGERIECGNAVYRDAGTGTYRLAATGPHEGRAAEEIMPGQRMALDRLGNWRRVPAGSPGPFCRIALKHGDREDALQLIPGSATLEGEFIIDDLRIGGVPIDVLPIILRPGQRLIIECVEAPEGADPSIEVPAAAANRRLE